VIAEFDAIRSLARQLRGTSNWNSPIAWRKKLASHGIPGLDAPLQFGGNNFSATQMVEFFAICGQIDLDLRDVPGVGHARIILQQEHINTVQQQIISRVVKSEDFVAVAITEEDAGSDIRNISTLALPNGKGYILNGEKLYVARLEQATHIIVFAKVIPSHYETISAFIVPIHSPGVNTKAIDAMGLHGVSFGGVSFHDVFLPDEFRLGNEGDGFRLFSDHFTYWRIAMAAAAVGCGRGAVNQAIDYLRKRQAFGGPIGRFTHLQQELSRHISHLHMTWLLVLSAADRLDSKKRAYVDAAMVKAEAVEAALDAADWSMQVHGARGYTTDLDLEKRVRDLKGLRVADGATDVLRGQVARELLGDELYDISLGRQTYTRHSVSLFPRNFWDQLD